MSILLTWLGLLMLLAIELTATLFHAGWLAAFVAPAMVVLVAVAFMKLLTETPLSRIFACAGLFWLAMLIGLGSIDFAVRRTVPVSPTTIQPG